MRMMTITQFCALQQSQNKTRSGGCAVALPLSKKYTNYGQSTNNGGNSGGSGGGNTVPSSCLAIRNKMQYAQYVRTYGGTQKSTSAIKKTCLIAGPSFTY